MKASPHAVDVIIIGAGQAGLSVSACLKDAGIAHQVLERDSPASSWKHRWDAFCLVTPNWSVRLPGEPYAGKEPHSFMGRDAVVAHLTDYAKRRCGPIQTGTEVRCVSTHGDDFAVHTQHDEWHARVVVVATSTHAAPRLPAFASRLPSNIASMHTAQYTNPQALAGGAVLVVGSGQSGAQIAQELHESGRSVFLSTSAVGRVPRRYRGLDIIDWQARMGFLDRHVSDLDSPSARFRPDPQLSGQRGGYTLDLRTLARDGVQLCGRLNDVDNAICRFDADCESNLQYADEFSADLIQRIDAFIQDNALDVRAPDRDNSDLGYDGEAVDIRAPATLDLRANGIETVLWATGFTRDLTFIDVPGFDPSVYPEHYECPEIRRLFFAGFNYVERRGSG
ncbi:MAG: NAD(P)-binding domain-containing protein, partial [Gammaproteobacteria bacterium]|nr:NAD(P)-binding domain-containing protein [Gammaproteobacteria bacterium]